MKIALLVAALSALAVPAWAQRTPKDCGPLPGAFDGIAFTGDGDTIYGMGFAPPIRIWGVQAPELRDKHTGIETRAGMASRTATEELLGAAGHQVHCAPRKWDRFCRVVAACTTGGKEGGGKDVGLELLRAGMAYGYWLSDAATPAQSIEYATAEAEARKQGRGLWKEWAGK